MHKGQEYESRHRYREFAPLQTKLMKEMKKESSGGVNAAEALRWFHFPNQGYGTRALGRSDHVLRRATIERFCSLLCEERYIDAVCTTSAFRDFFDVDI